MTDAGELAQILTIAIPTYNGANRIAPGLLSVLRQARDHADEVCVYVSDNCSTDGTEKCIRGYLSEWSDVLSYKRQSRNLGFEGNFRDCACNIRTKYMVLLGDDDIPLPTYVETILGVLHQSQDWGLIHLNALSANGKGELTGVRNHLMVPDHVRCYDNVGKLIKDHLGCPSLISSNVFQKEAFCREIEQVVSGEFPGFDWFMAMIRSARRKPCAYVDIPQFVMTVPGTCAWAKDAPWFLVYGLGRVFEACDDLCAGVSDAWVKMRMANGAEREYGFAMAKHRRVYRKRYPIMKPYICSPMMRYRLWFCLYVPMPIIRFVDMLWRIVPGRIRAYLPQ